MVQRRFAFDESGMPVTIADPAPRRRRAHNRFFKYAVPVQLEQVAGSIPATQRGESTCRAYSLVTKMIETVGFTVVGNTSEAFDKAIRAEIEAYAPIVKKYDIKG